MASNLPKMSVDLCKNRSANSCISMVHTIDLQNYIYQPRCSTRTSSSGNNFRQLTIPKTNSFRDTYFFLRVNLWNALPNEITTITSVSLFKPKLKSFYFQRLQYVFDQDIIRFYKIICPKCRKTNISTSCLC